MCLHPCFNLLTWCDHVKMWSVYSTLRFVFSSDTWQGITFGRRGNKLDLYHPPTLAKSGAPLVVFVYGGSWDSGKRSEYCLLARQMTIELNATVICPDYCTYPKVRAQINTLYRLLWNLNWHLLSSDCQGNILAMVQDVADCLVWTQESGQNFNFDKVRYKFSFIQIA